MNDKPPDNLIPYYVMFLHINLFPLIYFCLWFNNFDDRQKNVSVIRWNKNQDCR